MSIKSRFLTLSMKEQICLVIIALTLFCILVVLGICCSLSYEFLKEDYKQKRLYFFNKYKEYIESTFYFKNFCLLQYEEIIRRVINQGYNFLDAYNDYNSTDFDNYTNKFKNYNDSLHYNIKDNKTDDPVFYMLCFFESNMLDHDILCGQMYDVTALHYQSMTNTFIYHDIYNFIRIPGYNIPIIDSQAYISINLSTIFSFNTTTIHEALIYSQGFSDKYNYNYSNMNNYYNKKINDITSRIKEENLLFYFFQQSTYFEHIFSNVFSKIKLFLKADKIDVLLYEYLSNIHYGNNSFSQIHYDQNEFFFYSETKLINNFFYFLLNRISIFLDSFFIPLYHENSTIVSPKLCFLFLLNQIKFQIDNININELFNAIKKGKSYFDNCLAYNNKVNSQKDMKDILNLNFSSFFNLNNLILQNIMY